MPYQSIWEERGIHWKYTGLLTGDEILQSNMDIYGDPRFDRLRYQIVDMLGVETFDVSTESMEEVALMDVGASTTNPRVVVAVVATDAQGKRLNELYETVAGGASWETELFLSLEEARAWITSKCGITWS
jgi:hypothetical protein